MNIVIVDYGCSNVQSVKNAVEYIGFEVNVSGSIEDIENADLIILPGVGKYDIAMSSLHETGLANIIRSKVLGGTRILGICLGFQLLFEGSEEGDMLGLGLVNGRFKKFISSKVNMGWRGVEGNSMLIDSINEPRFYFVHSYYLPTKYKESSDLFSIYNTKEFVCGIWRDNICGIQFHPEKSHKYGLKLLKNFIELN